MNRAESEVSENVDNWWRGMIGSLDIGRGKTEFLIAIKRHAKGQAWISVVVTKKRTCFPTNLDNCS
jgi:hypothetical protein